MEKKKVVKEEKKEKKEEKKQEVKKQEKKEEKKEEKEIKKKEDKKEDKKEEVKEEVKKKKGKEKFYFGKGGRKEARANVRFTSGKGEVKVNEKELKEYFPEPFLQEEVLKPLLVTGNEKKFDLLCKVSGGGKNGQADALKLGIARALVAQNEKLREILRKNGLLTRDPRMKERKKYGQKGARKKFQFTKR